MREVKRLNITRSRKISMERNFYYKIFFGWVLRRTNTIKLIWRLSSITGGKEVKRVGHCQCHWSFCHGEFIFDAFYKRHVVKIGKQGGHTKL